MSIKASGKYYKWLVLLSVGTGLFLATIDGSIVNVALPTLVKALNTDFSIIQWVVLAYLLTVTTLMLSIGRLGDMVGKKPLYMAGQVIFTIGSVLCGLSNNVFQLIAFRVFQAIGASMIMALSSAIVTEAFPPEERGRALGVHGTMVSIGIIAGPTIGGLILQTLSWHWIFFVNIPVGFLGIWMVQKFVPDKKPAGGQKFDFWGAAALFVSLLSLLFGLTMGQRLAFTDLRVLGLFGCGLLFLAAFIGIEMRVNQPMIDLKLFKNPLFSINLITGFLAFVASAGTIFLMPFYLQNILGYDPSRTGLLMASVPFIIGIVAPLAGGLSDRYGTRLLAAIGLLILIFGYMAVSTLSLNTSASGYVLRFILVAIGIGLFQSPNNSAIMGAVPHSRLGVASGLLSITRTMGQTVGIALLGALWAINVAGRAGSDVSDAPLNAQVIGLQQTMCFVVVLIFIAWLLSVWALRQWVKMKKGGTNLVPPQFGV